VAASCRERDAEGRAPVIRWIVRVVLRLAATALLVSLGAVAAYRFVDPPLTPLMVIRAVEDRAAGRRIRVVHEWVALGDVSPALVRAVLAAEDARFLVHHGVDFEAVERAYDYNARHRGRRLRGAGTISMQCARNVFLWPGRTYVRKGLETYLAWLLELVWGKRRILEVYLNVVEWGDGLYGAEAASRTYFGVPASRLDAWQAGLLAAALPNPRHRNPSAPSRSLRAQAALIAARATRVYVDPLQAAVPSQDGVKTRKY
jgi:monofunctional biosynthetic peptidoglycan transglycosylase